MRERAAHRDRPPHPSVAATRINYLNQGMLVKYSETGQALLDKRHADYDRLKAKLDTSTAGALRPLARAPSSSLLY